MNYLDKLFSLEGKAAVVTGAARGNGRAISEALCRAGANVVLVDLLETELGETLSFFQAEGLRAIPFLGDITDEPTRERLAELVWREYGKIDALFNNAGVSYSHPLFSYPDADWEKTYRVNLYAPYKIATIFGKMMATLGSGSIVNITSLNAELAFPDNPAYVAFKGALCQLTKSLALDLGRFGVRANNIGPGYFETNMTKLSYNDPVKNKQRSDRTVLGRWGKPEDLAGIAIFLASDASAYVTGQDIYVDGGWMIKGL
jgi:NAD(P)-dependent dehydrogenase (short-subunit alcohol dehydrogenase family)